ncbi:MAG: hypothetical protein V2A73_12410, partial [Pseudomonadota bacterium]
MDRDASAAMSTPDSIARAPIGLPDRGRRSAGGAAARSEEGAYPSVCDRRATQRMRPRHESADG